MGTNSPQILNAFNAHSDRTAEAAACAIAATISGLSIGLPGTGWHETISPPFSCTLCSSRLIVTSSSALYLKFCSVLCYVLECCYIKQKDRKM